MDVSRSEDKFLYAGKTNAVTEYNPKTAPFATVSAPRVVEFYSPMCPACVAFSSHYMKMAENTKKLYPDIQFFGVSCDTYEKVCHEYGVEGYPTLHFFKAEDGPTSKGIEREFDDKEARDKSTPRKIAALVNVQFHETLGNETTKSEKVGMDDGRPSVLGKDSSGYKRKQQYLELFEAAKANVNLSPEEFGAELRKTERNQASAYGEMTKGMKQNTPGTREFLDREKSFQTRIELSKTKNNQPATTQSTAGKKNFPYSKDVTKPKWFRANKKMSEEEELILDTTLSLYVSLESGISMGITDVTSKSAMKQWLNLLSVSLPPEWNIHKLIDFLKDNFEHATESKKSFKEMLKKYHLNRKGWSRSCQNKELNSAGFSCGFWKLIHVITLGIAEQRGGHNLIISGMMHPKTLVFSPALAADTIRNYIDKFFTCKPCRDHFLATYDDCKNNQRCKRLTHDENTNDPSDWKELAMYFWEVHNDVSVRLVGERIQSTYTHGVRNNPTTKDEVAVIFPDIRSCILCFENDGTWNKAEVFGFLERTYWPDSQIDPLTDMLLTFDGESKSGLGMLFLAAILTVWFVFRIIRKQSLLIHHSLVAARQVVLRKSRTL